MKRLQRDMLTWILEIYKDKITDLPLLSWHGMPLDEVIDNANIRYTEEAIELTQALGISKEKLLKIIDHVYAKDSGAIEQEVGGVMTTLAHLGNVHGFNLKRLANRELRRMFMYIEKIREKQKTKPMFKD